MIEPLLNKVKKIFKKRESFHLHKKEEVTATEYGTEKKF